MTVPTIIPFMFFMVMFFALWMLFWFKIVKPPIDRWMERYFDRKLEEIRRRFDHD